MARDFILQKSLEIIADFLECKNEKILSDLNLFKKILEKILKKSKIAKIKSLGYVFKNFNGFTYISILKESHLAIHTWPEKKLANIDIFLCNYTQDNSKKVKNFLQELKKELEPQKVKQKNIKRIT